MILSNVARTTPEELARWRLADSAISSAQQIASTLIYKGYGLNYRKYGRQSFAVSTAAKLTRTGLFVFKVSMCSRNSEFMNE